MRSIKMRFEHTMTFRLKATLAAVASALTLLALPKPSVAAQTLEEIPGIAGLRWSTGVQMLPSGGVITVPAHAKLLSGAEVRKFQDIMSDVTGNGFDQTAEAELRFTRFGTVEYQFCNCGYTIPDDWNCVSTEEVISSIRRYYEDLGWDEVIDFARPPHYDRSHATITYLLHLRNSSLPNYYEGNALIFGRGGFETLVAVTRTGNAAGAWSELEDAIAAFHFVSGRSFSDYRRGDQTSAMHIAAQFAKKAGADDLVSRYASCRTGVI
jgi:hypothetical protein